MKTINPYFYYIIKVFNKERCFIKVGEANSKKRPNTLLEKYQKNRSVTAELLHIGELPSKHEKRLNDKAIHKELDKVLKRADHYAIAYMLGTEDGIHEFFDPAGKSDAEIICLVSNIAEELGRDASNFTCKLKSYVNLALHYDPDKKHLVKYKLIKSMENMLGECMSFMENKNILLVGQFIHDWIATFALRNNVYIMHDSNEQIHDYDCDLIDEKITYIKEFKELIDLDMDFDIIISNPPYDQGNAITQNIVDNISFEKFINLMPLKCYKRGKIFRNIDKFEVVDPKVFNDAIITENLNIASIDLIERDIEWDEFELDSFNPKFREFYEKNLTLKHYAIDESPMGSNGRPDRIIDKSKNIRCAFAVPTRTVHAGVNKTSDCFDYKWNIEKSLGWEDVHIAPQGGCTVAFIYFNTEAENSNFCKYWYSRDLSHQLIKGLNKRSGSPRIAIPRIDWSRTDVEYTDEYVLEQMGLRWNVNKDGVEKI